MVTVSRLIARDDGCRALSLPTKPYCEHVAPYIWLSLVTVLAADLRLRRLDLIDFRNENIAQTDRQEYIRQLGER